MAHKISAIVQAQKMWHGIQWLYRDQIELPKTLKGKSCADIMRNLHKYYRLSDGGKPANKTTAAFRAVWAAAHAQDWKMPFTVIADNEYENVIAAAIIFFHAADPVISRGELMTTVKSGGYAAW